DADRAAGAEERADAGRAVGAEGASLDRAAAHDEESEQRRGGGLLRRALVVALIVVLILAGFYVSLLATSEPVTAEQRQLIERAIDVLDARGLGDHTFALRRLASYRTTDNWWNDWNGHREAYAATNFPFEIVTLYPDFFTQPADDTERAVILLHESYHLAGAGEETAFSGVWRDKAKLGWTKEAYGRTLVWRNVREFTSQNAPRLFRCGDDGKGDCLE
ncbi:MAG: hypothetical protein M3268_07075, partial [Acidobacteriota bacterium]|nr:hypothetical protein [Acidobacteriota bacterium]